MVALIVNSFRRTKLTGIHRCIFQIQIPAALRGWHVPSSFNGFFPIWSDFSPLVACLIGRSLKTVRSASADQIVIMLLIAVILLKPYQHEKAVVIENWHVKNS